LQISNKPVLIFPCLEDNRRCQKFYLLSANNSGVNGTSQQ